MAFEMACGRPPFIASSRVEVCAMHLGEAPPVPSSIRPGLPPPFDVLVARLLDKEPEGRPTMREVTGTFTALGESVGIALTTLPPRGVLSPFATPSSAADSSMQYKATPRAGFQSQNDMPKAVDPIAQAPTPIAGTDLRNDATPVASMSLQFRATPRAGFQSQNDMPVATDRPSGPMGAGHGMQMRAAKKRGIGLYVVIGVVIGGVVIGATIAIVSTRGKSSKESAGSGEPRGSGSAIAAGSTESGSTRSGSAGSGESAGVRSGSAGSGESAVAGVRSGSGEGSGEGASVRSGSGEGSAAPPRPKLPKPRTGAIPELAAAVDLEVCINRDGEVVSVVLANGAPPERVVNAAVTAWQYARQDRDRMCGVVTLPAHAAMAAKVNPPKLTKKLFEDSLAEVNESIFECIEKQTKDGVFTINIAVSPAGLGRVAGWGRGATLPTPAFKACIAGVVKRIRFAPTRQGGSGSTTLEVDQIDG
ncbi:MAG: hypothetical protein H0V17_14640 [Deltaproteobacteria bacterium]|nr:hypothetical protein [Deltaproteobacteria bacterium]